MTDDTEPIARSTADLEVGDEGPTVTFENLSRKDIVRYAGASGDFNPIHYDETLAKSKGNPSVFAQGMLTAGITTRPLREWFGLGPLDSYSVRFVAKVWPGDTLTTATEIESITNTDGTEALVEVDVTVRNQSEEVVATGSATVRLPDGE